MLTDANYTTALPPSSQVSPLLMSSAMAYESTLSEALGSTLGGPTLSPGMSGSVEDGELLTGGGGDNGLEV